MSQPALFDLESLNQAKRADLRAHDVETIWLLVSAVELQALADGVVGTQLRQLCQQALHPLPQLRADRED